MRFHETDDVHIVLPEAALGVIFDECDRFDQDETGGRLVGQFKENGGRLTLHITGIIEPGPQARRTAISFFQDGEYQERVFRRIEDLYPEIEHLGSWHTHHVNGLQHLSGGDLATYHRTVNHQNHNTSFFYALLVTTKHKTDIPLERYSIKHYVFRRGDERVFEIPKSQVEIVKQQLIWPTLEADRKSVTSPSRANPKTPAALKTSERVSDRDFLLEFYKAVRPFTSGKLGFYWRGTLELVDGSQLQVVVLEGEGRDAPTYSVALPKPADALKATAEELAKEIFPSARAALVKAERTCNRALFQHHIPAPGTAISTKG